MANENPALTKALVTQYLDELKQICFKNIDNATDKTDLHPMNLIQEAIKEVYKQREEGTNSLLV